MEKYEMVNWGMVFIACYWVLGGVINHWMVSSILNGPEGIKKRSCMLYICETAEIFPCHFPCEMTFFCRLTGLLVSLFLIQPWLASSSAQPWLTSHVGHNRVWDRHQQYKQKRTNKSACSGHKEMSQASANLKGKGDEENVKGSVKERRSSPEE